MARTSSTRTRPAVNLARRLPTTGRGVSTQSKPPVPTGGFRPSPPLNRGAKTFAPTSGATRTPDPSSGGFAALLESTVKEILAVTYWFEPTPYPEPYPVTIRFAGRRTDVEGRPQARDQFLHEETIERVLPGSGPISLTARVYDFNPGIWTVTAHIVEPGRQTRGPRSLGKETVAGGARLSAARLWSRWASITGTETAVKTCLVPFAKVPGIVPGIWGALVTLGMLVALALQFLVIALAHLALSSAWLITLVSIAFGILGAKIWFIVLHRRAHRIDGWCIQGFITGAVLAATVLLVLLHASAGSFLDATAPGLLVALSIGRVGCFFAGCCGGPPTASRWGVWSSDQRVGARRVPTQLLESVLALVLGLAALGAVLGYGPAGGTFFVGGLALYTLGRQVILHRRAEHSTKWPEALVTLGLAALVLAVEISSFVH